MATKIKHISQIDDSVTIDLDVDGVHVVVYAKSDVTVTALAGIVKVAEEKNYSNGRTLRMNIRPTLREPDESHSAPGACGSE
jgi:hypothetical protein